MVKFWKDIWCGDEPLCVSFPSLFALAVFKDAWVKDVWRCNEGGGSWSPLFSRPFNDWELDEVCRFFVALIGKRVQQTVDDRVIWRETKCGKFSVTVTGIPMKLLKLENMLGRLSRLCSSLIETHPNPKPLEDSNSSALITISLPKGSFASFLEQSNKLPF